MIQFLLLGAHDPEKKHARVMYGKKNRYKKNLAPEGAFKTY